MDNRQFDHLARSVSGALSRRSALAAALAAMTAGPAAAIAEVGPAAGAGREAGEPASRRGRGAGRPGALGPCGDGTRKDNICTANADCCTGLCATKLGKRNKDRQGRCRCARQRQACTEDRNCCNTLTCVSGVCGGGAGPTPPPPPPPPPPPETCTVCASGCGYATIEDAWAGTAGGGVITVDAGVYPTSVAVDKDMTVRACNGVDGVVLQLRTGTPRFAIFQDADDAPATLAVEGLTFDLAGTDSYGIYGLANLTVAATGCTFREGRYAILIEDESPGGVTLDGCSFRGQTRNMIKAREAALSINGSTFTSTELIDCILFTDAPSLHVSDTTVTCPGAGAYAIAGEVLGELVFERVTSPKSGFALSARTGTFTGCYISGGSINHGGGMELWDGDFTLKDTVISGCEAKTYGGGIAVRALQRRTSLTLLNGVVITGNSARNGSGIAASAERHPVKVTGANRNNVFGNTDGSQCAEATDVLGEWTPVPNCNF